MTRFAVVPACEAHVAAIAGRVRPADRDELWASAMVTPEVAMAQGLEMSYDAVTWMVDEMPMAIAGISPGSFLGGVGVPWMVGTTGLVDHPIPFLRASRKMLSSFQERHAHLMNYVDARNTAAIAWLSWLGFEIGEPSPYGLLGLPFHRFEWRQPCATR